MINFNAVDFSIYVILKKWKVSFDAQCMLIKLEQFDCRVVNWDASAFSHEHYKSPKV